MVIRMLTRAATTTTTTSLFQTNFINIQCFSHRLACTTTTSNNNIRNNNTIIHKLNTHNKRLDCNNPATLQSIVRYYDIDKQCKLLEEQETKLVAFGRTIQLMREDTPAYLEQKNRMLHKFNVLASLIGDHERNPCIKKNFADDVLMGNLKRVRTDVKF
tara:strand:- start:2676 stop:3152 length:477 start_codon:yes stop_codon:yes gene_type:complete